MVRPNWTLTQSGLEAVARRETDKRRQSQDRAAKDAHNAEQTVERELRRGPPHAEMHKNEQLRFALRKATQDLHRKDSVIGLHSCIAAVRCDHWRPLKVKTPGLGYWFASFLT
mmetsp:Transcript_46855/g.124476  ORF Transcript_46855/g.124476 Transcript_46855/m.124476 type:complete len:113 (+) Transcript_46855:224-562(+)